MAVWKGLYCLSVHLCIRIGLSWLSEPAETLFMYSPMIHVNQLNILLHSSSGVLQLPGSAQWIFISWYAWISVDVTGSSHTAIVSGRQALVLWLWSTCCFKPLFYIFNALIQAESSMFYGSWQAAVQLRMGPPTALPSTEISSGLWEDQQWALSTGTEALLTRMSSGSSSIKLARMAEVHRGVLEVCCRRSLCCSGIKAVGANTGAAAVEGRTVGRGAQRCVSLSHCLGPEVVLLGVAGCVLLPLFL